MPQPAAAFSTPWPESAEEPLEPISAADLATLTAARATPGHYPLGPDSTTQEGVPRGSVSQHHWASVGLYPGVERDYWVYVPQQYDGSRPACLMVFQDAPLYLGPEATIPLAFDNLFVLGEGGHSLAHGGAIFPETMRWLWRDYPR